MNMTREIKFRAWYQEKMYRYVEHVTFEDGSWHVSALFPNSANRTFLPSNDGDKAPVLMQFTGLKDKNGTEVYESDLMFLKTQTSEFLYVVKYEDAKFVLYHVRNNYGRWGDLHRIFEPDFNQYGITVIGNIHENPELLLEK